MVNEQSDNTPHVEAAEGAVLSAMLRDSNMIVRALGDGITEEHFHVSSYRRLFAMLVSQHREGKPCDPPSVAAAASLAGELDKIGVETFSSLATFPVMAEHWMHHRDSLNEARARRLAIKEADAIASCASTTDAQKLAQMARSLSERVAEATSGRSAVVSPKEAVEAFTEHFRACFEAGENPGASTGIAELDQATGGLRPGELWVVCAETSGGKSALCVQMAAEALDRNENVLFVTLELSAAEVVGRFVSVMHRCPYGWITKPRTLPKMRFEGIKQTMERIARSGLYILDQGGLTIENIVTHAKQLADRVKLSMVVVDYVQLVDGGRQKGESREQEVSRVSRLLKQLAKTLGCPVVSPSQLNDEGKVRESRAIAHDSDTMLIIRGDNGIDIAKARNAPRGTNLELFLDGSIQRFTSTRPHKDQ